MKKPLYLEDLRKEAAGLKASYAQKIIEQDLLLMTIEKPHYLMVSTTSDAEEFDTHTHFPSTERDHVALTRTAELSRMNLIYIRVVLHDGKWRRVAS